MLNLNGYKKLSSDFGLNLISNLISVGTMQLFVYPVIASSCEPTKYGLFLTVIGLINTIGGTFGNSLNNVRLITHEEYSKSSLVGDFNILLFSALLLNVICIVAASCFFQYSIILKISFVILALFSIVRNYISVEFRLKINYVKVLFMNVVMSVGYLLGVLCYKYLYNSFDGWVLIFLISEILCFVYLYRETLLLKEPFVRTTVFFKTFHKYGNLIYTSLISSILLYFDRNLLFPLLGGAAVSTYFAATVVGKASSLVAGPMSSVLLSYYAQVDFEMTQKKFWQINKAICCAGVLTYIGTILVVDLIVSFLYPSLYLEAKKIFYIANIVPILDVIANMARPAVIRYVSLDKLSVFQTLFLSATVGISYFAITYYGLIGFCYGAIILSVIRVAVMWTLGHLVLAGK